MLLNSWNLVLFVPIDGVRNNGFQPARGKEIRFDRQSAPYTDE